MLFCESGGKFWEKASVLGCVTSCHLSCTMLRMYASTRTLLAGARPHARIPLGLTQNNRLHLSIDICRSCVIAPLGWAGKTVEKAEKQTELGFYAAQNIEQHPPPSQPLLYSFPPCPPSPEEEFPPSVPLPSPTHLRNVINMPHGSLPSQQNPLRPQRRLPTAPPAPQSMRTAIQPMGRFEPGSKPAPFLDDSVFDKTGRIGGIDEEGEAIGVWRPSGHFPHAKQYGGTRVLTVVVRPPMSNSSYSSEA
ncbi:hypothetical protein R3P38DRAFT_2786819 [Favolaschia claudopus]|uniref:Uncharacterized protein n=1 Tax=Favolaschia claudopus TaxID=2862362 RepID=A0AAW0APL1_9AGAR